ncbi:2-oxoacid:acceptor oxidoreductase subunit alpha [Candidatus Acetothermia bacterium]|jgi:2-oxoglutarate ferredoxin oxidoreductase subunit alpha|nr:2-oxoacid:acceptor oxidoreductase subunit alpha [Candidatus Acetothermia bacterium]MCI2431722.1 2-oxoacid:acceptor oxidoreductase subunit alpha [Candidatus Acetothermia bacterium]MCI2436682.1 2-oxoacid:acceptor oxidoreductase subunit alpha [Candidatus Acetothermia bacterium]
MQRVNDLAWLVGGAQGSGVDSAANLFAKAGAFGGLYIYGQREYYSNIMGEHSYYQVCVGARPVRATRSHTDVLVSSDAETVFLHAPSVVQGGALVYDPKLTETSLSKVAALEHRARREIEAYLSAKNLPVTMGGMLQDAESRGVKLYPIPFDELLQKIAGGQLTQLAQAKRMSNAMAVAASCAVLGYEIKFLEHALENIFHGKKKVVEANVKACDLAYEYVAQKFKRDFFVRLEPLKTDEPRLYITGAQAVALGKLAAGCTMQTYYPISPATDESVYLESHQLFETREGTGAILVVQTEDEIAAVTMATGAALTGARAATSTSGPGFSLMVEALGWAGINEVPLVVTLYQRGSPSTGLPTRHEQGDLRFVLHAGHGEFPRIVIASGDLEECFYDEIGAFNYAERYQLPVVHLLDKSIASSSQTQKPFDLQRARIERGLLLSSAEAPTQEGDYKRFLYTETGISPRTVLGTRDGLFWNTGDEHDEWGHITEDPVERVQMMEKRAKKLEVAAREIPRAEKFNVFGDPEADLVLLSWGSPKGAILDALEALRAEKQSVCFVQCRLLWPLPGDDLRELLEKAKRRACIENNYSGQFAGLVREQTGIAMDHLIVKFNGRPITMDEVYQSVKEILSGEAPQRMVLTHGA